MSERSLQERGQEHCHSVWQSICRNIPESQILRFFFGPGVVYRVAAGWITDTWVLLLPNIVAERPGLFTFLVVQQVKDMQDLTSVATPIVFCKLGPTVSQWNRMWTSKATSSPMVSFFSHMKFRLSSGMFSLLCFWSRMVRSRWTWFDSRSKVSDPRNQVLDPWSKQVPKRIRAGGVYRIITITLTFVAM